MEYGLLLAAFIFTGIHWVGMWHYIYEYETIYKTTVLILLWIITINIISLRKYYSDKIEGKSILSYQTDGIHVIINLEDKRIITSVKKFNKLKNEK